MFSGESHRVVKETVKQGGCQREPPSPPIHGANGVQGGSISREGFGVSCTMLALLLQVEGVRSNPPECHGLPGGRGSVQEC